MNGVEIDEPILVGSIKGGNMIIIKQCHDNLDLTHNSGGAGS